MDKAIIYEITTNDTKEKTVIKITTTGFPITEKIEYQEENRWTNNPITENNTTQLDKILEDNNIRLIMDVMQQHDKYYINKYNTTVEVVNAEIVDDYAE